MVTDWSNNLASGGLKATKALNFLTTDSFTRKLRFEKILKFGPTLCEEKSLLSQIVSNQYAHPFFRFLLKPQRRCTRKKWFDKTHNTLFSIFILVKEKKSTKLLFKIQWNYFWWCWWKNNIWKRQFFAHNKLCFTKLL